MNEEQLKLFDKLMPIPQDAKVINYIPELFTTAGFCSRIDWNYNTIAQTVQKFDILRPKHPKLNSKDFWCALMRGGIQGAVYYSDTVAVEAK